MANNLAKYVDLTLIQPEKLAAKCKDVLDKCIQVFRFRKPRIRDSRNLLAMRAMMGIIREVQPDVLHVQETNELLFFGRIWPYKGLKYLLEAMPLVAERIPEVKLIIAGRGENIENLIDKQDIKHYEILNGFIPNQALAPLFQRSAATILPYIESSQSGVAAIAYALSTPVIASEIGGLKEVIRHEQNGLLVPPRDVRALADAIIRLLSDSQLQHQMQLAALERCQQDLNWSNIAAQTVKVYHQAIAAKNISRIGL